MRSDLPERVANELLPVLAGSIAEKIEATNAETKVSARKLIDDARSLLADRLRAAVSRARPLAILNDQVGRGNLTVAEAVVELATPTAWRSRRLRRHAARRAQRHGRSRSFPRRRATLMLICRAAALDLDAFSAVLRMRDRRRRGSAVERHN